jgi:hypothetical protein
LLKKYFAVIAMFLMQTGAQVVYSKYAGTEVEFNDAKHLILKEEDIIGILETADVKDIKPLNDRVLIKVFIYFLLVATILSGMMLIIINSTLDIAPWSYVLPLC